MSSKYTHCYSNYVSHILNNSPTKITYTFPKGERFQSPKKQKDAPIDNLLHTVYPQANKMPISQGQRQSRSSNKKFMNNFIQSQKSNPMDLVKNRSRIKTDVKNDLKRSRSKSQNKNVSPFQKYLNQQVVKSNQRKKFSRSKSAKAIRKEIQRKSPSFHDFQNVSQQAKRKVWDKAQSPTKQEKMLYLLRDLNYTDRLKQTGHSYNMPHQQNVASGNRYSKYSPYYRQYLINNQDEKKSSRQKKWQNQSISRSKSSHKIITPTIVLQEIDHPSKNITIHGYYPVGTEINPNGKYVSSTYKNVPSHSFGSPQAKNQKKNQGKSFQKKSPGKTQKRRRSKDGNDIRVSFDLSNNYDRLSGKNGTILSHKRQIPSEVDYYYRHLTEKKNRTGQMPKTEQVYVPFSEFGYVNAFRY